MVAQNADPAAREKQARGGSEPSRKNLCRKARGTNPVAKPCGIQLQYLLLRCFSRLAARSSGV